MTAARARTQAVEAAERAFREARAVVLATLIRRLGDVDLAEEAMQDAFAVALRVWDRDGVPEEPAAWLTVAARRRAIDRLRRSAAEAGRAERLAALVALEHGADDTEEEEDDRGSALADDRLRLIFTCCHPALNEGARIALTLRMLGGLTTAEIARAFLVAEPAMTRRITRAKRKIADARIPYRVPPDEELGDRVRGVLRVVYLIFTEGHTATAGDALVRGALCAEAIRLARLLAGLLPDDAECRGLLALLLLLHARAASRTGADGAYVALEEQDPARWDRALVAEGEAQLRRALRLRAPGTYQLQAAIAALHAAPGGTDWARVAVAYEALAVFEPTPVVAVNRAVALAFAGEVDAGLALLAPLRGDPALARYRPLAAAEAELLRRAGDTPAARAAYDRAIALGGNAVERAELARRRAALG